jgi:hypothetical protein
MLVLLIIILCTRVFTVVMYYIYILCCAVLYYESRLKYDHVCMSILMVTLFLSLDIYIYHFSLFQSLSPMTD